MDDHETAYRDFPIWKEVKHIDIEILTDTFVVLRKLSTDDFTVISSTEIVELNFLKNGCRRSKNTATGKRYNSGQWNQWEDRNAQITADLCDT